jgi:CPA2 family monovalent cation:H+ antiporter-2
MLFVTILKIAMLVVLVFFIGGRLVPRILRMVARTDSRELFTLAVLVVALGIAVGSAVTFNASMALGAFLAGMVVGQSEFSLRAASEALPMRDAFAVLFFVSVGMLFDPAQLMQAPLMLVLTLAIVLVAKPIAAFALVVLLGYGTKAALGVAAALAQIGEFSLILATVGDELQILPAGSTNTVVAASIISISLNPFIYRYLNHIEGSLRRWPRTWERLNRENRGSDQLQDSHAPQLAYHAVVVGYGPIGKTLARLLREGGIVPVIIDLNVETVQRLHNEGYRAVYGDAGRREVLEAASVGSAVGLVISGPAPEEATEIIRIARSLNPKLPVLARTEFLKDAILMRDAGANEVFSGEGEVALAMTEAILRQLGSTPEQIDHERRRVHEEVFHGRP